jgi:transcriptional regulator with XRE-family HTH domain
MMLINPMSESSLGIVMASGLAPYLRAELNKRGWPDSQLADTAGIDRSTLTNIFKNPDTTPKLETLDRLAKALQVPLAKLVTLCGFSIEGDDGTNIDEQVSILLDSMPELRGFIAHLAQLRPDDLRVIQAYVDGFLQKR